jgi:sirohydrochlorin cobaltochelatase
MMTPSYSSRDVAPTTRVVLLTPVDLPDAILDDWRAQCGQLAGFLGAPVELCRPKASEPPDPEVEAALGAIPAERREVIEPLLTGPAAPMPAAPFLWRPDGRPDWRAMWTSFCELALFGGPPHRGPESALVAGPAADPGTDGSDAVEEIRRGIWETTGLYSEPSAPGWLAVTCESPRMAAWLCATIILENVDARCDEERLLVPADPSFTLSDQVKSVITVVAKTHHYWSAHAAGGAGRP